MQILDTTIPEVKELRPARHRDERGFFSEVYRRTTLAELGIGAEFAQDNHVGSARRGTIRGLHMQAPPHAQAKLVRVSRGAIFDVSLDVRIGSPTYGHHTGIVVSADLWNMLWVPEGFAHGYCTLEDDTEVQYKVSRPWAPASERGVLFCDPELSIPWPIDVDEAIVAERDTRWPTFAQLDSPFSYLG